MPKKILLLCLQTFSATGGIQKMTRTLAHALNEVAGRNNWALKLLSLYDDDSDLMPQYLPAAKFKGFNVNRAAFILQSLKLVPRTDIIIITHVNMAIIGVFAKAINPKCQVWLIAHGIEVWRPLSYFKKKLLNNCDKIICVSNFTRLEIARWHAIDTNKCEVLNNAIDPFMKLPAEFKKPAHILQRYGLKPNDLVLFTLTRLAATEQYKGYEQVIKIMGKLKAKFPNIKYVLSGKHDPAEEARIKTMISKYGVEQEVLLTGYVEEDELPEHFLMADVFVLPSIKEGFGIVFIEAIACGLPVICGNVDGSLDAIRNGELGKAVDPDNLTELEEAISAALLNLPAANMRKHLQKRCLHYFNEADYINKLQSMLKNEPAD